NLLIEFQITATSDCPQHLTGDRNTFLHVIPKTLDVLPQIAKKKTPTFLMPVSTRRQLYRLPDDVRSPSIAGMLRFALSLPDAPRRLAGGPQFFQIRLVAQRIHRLPEA